MRSKYSRFISIILALIFFCPHAALAGPDLLRPTAYKDRKNPAKNGVTGVLDQPEYYPELLFNLRTRREFVALRDNGMILKDLYRKLSPDSKRDLLNPNVMLMLLGALHSCVRDRRMDPYRFCGEIAALKPGLPLNFVITDHFIVEANFLLARLERDGGFLVDIGGIKQEEVDYLLTGPMTAEKAKLIGEITERTLPDLYKRAAAMTFIMGYPIQYLRALANTTRDSNVMLARISRYGMQIPTTSEDTGIDNPMIQSWDAMLDYGYALLASESDFDEMISARTKTAFDYRINLVAPLAEFLLGLRARSEAAQNTARAI